MEAAVRVGFGFIYGRSVDLQQPREILGQIAQSRSYSYALGLEVGIIHILGALGLLGCR